MAIIELYTGFEQKQISILTIRHGAQILPIDEILAVT